jgi:hypothetical protein
MKKTKNLIDYYITPTHDFTQYVKDHAEKYWHKDAAFDWSQNILTNLETYLKTLDNADFSKIAFMSIPIIKEDVERKIADIKDRQIPADADALKDIGESISFDSTIIDHALVIQKPLQESRESLSKVSDEVGILKSEIMDLHELQRLGLFSDGQTVKLLESEAEREEQGSKLAELNVRYDQVQEKSKRLKLQLEDASKLVKTKIQKELNQIEAKILEELEETSRLLNRILELNVIPQDPENLERLTNLILRRQFRGLKDIANHALVVEQSAIAPLTMGVIHYKRHREIQEAITTFVNDEAKHSATFRRYLVEKLEAKEYISDVLIKGAIRYMWLARFIPRLGMFMGVIIEAIGAASLEFFGKNDFMPESLFRSISKTISQQDEVRHLDLCVGIYNELYHKGTRWETFQNSQVLTVMLKSVYGDKTNDHQLIQAFRVFGVESDVLYWHVMTRLSEQLARIGFYITPEKLLIIIGRKQK